MNSPKIVKTENQSEIFHALNNFDIIFLNGIFGTGKSYISIKAACEYLTSGRVDRILITRALIECGGSIGFLPGDISEKSAPYFIENRNYLDEFANNNTRLKAKVEYQPIELLRGRNYDNTFMILDEAQNATKRQIMMLISRMGVGSKLMIIGDAEQSDINDSFFKIILSNKHRVKNAAFVTLNDQDFFRNKNALQLYGELCNI